ncbi:MAG: hypothetical protein AW07_04673 [Candidatus Accumulibacter sp. SK-11]|nr:MAG: hypothetical protein AW07_04673 [Candidatus Accumulibacter sp. SK-11]
MQRAVGIGGEVAHEFGDAVGGAAVVVGRADVVERIAVSVREDVDVLGREVDRRQRVVAAEAVEPARLVREQRQARLLGAAAGGDQVDFAGDEGGLRRSDGERVQGFGDDLRRQAGDGEEDSSRVGAGVFAGVGHGSTGR